MPKKKLYIAVKCGLIEDSKHREALGNRVWLYLHILNRCNWDTGQIIDWRDRDEAADLDMNARTLTVQRQELVELGYISCQQKRNHQVITVKNWTNPRSYEGTKKTVPLDFGDTDKPVPLPEDATDKTVPINSEGTAEGTAEGTYEGSNEIGTPTLDSKDRGQSTKSGRAETYAAIELIKKVAGFNPKPKLYEVIIDTLGSCPDEKKLAECFQVWISRDYNPRNLAWALEWYPNGIPSKKNGNGSHSEVARTGEMTAAQLAAETKRAKR